MRSVSYRICRSMRNLDDCLDHSQQDRPVQVDVQREDQDWPGELAVFRQWSARMQWRFPDEVVEVVRVYGWFPMSLSPGDVREAAVRAERRFRQDLSRMAGLPVTVTGKSWASTSAGPG